MTAGIDVDRLIGALRSRVDGEVIAPSSDQYDTLRSVWNARIDRYPLVIVQAASTRDVSEAVAVADSFDIDVRAKGGGHHIAGGAISDGGITIDLSPMNAVSLDAVNQTVTVGGGATWGEVDAVTQAQGLAAVGGQDPNIGVAGLTLGGGVGWLSRAYGLAADNLLRAEVVTANGEIVTASEHEHPDLFWGLRGGGGAIGIVTEFTFTVYPVDTVLAGSLVYPIDRGREVLSLYRTLCERAPKTVRPLFGLFELPDSSPLSDEVETDRVAIIIVCCIEPFEEATEVLHPLRASSSPLVDSIKERSYRTFQGAGESEPHARTALRSRYLRDLSDEAIDRIVRCGVDVPSDGTTVFVSPRGGAEVEPAVGATAYPNRHPCHHVLVEARWTDPVDDAIHDRWVADCESRLMPVTSEYGSINFIDADEPSDRIEAALGANYERFTSIKREWDPADRFGGHGRDDWGTQSEQHGEGP